MSNIVDNFNQYINESKFTHKIKSEKYWRAILGNNKYGNKVLDTILHKQNGFASDRQYEILKRIERGDTKPYHPKN